MKSILKYLALLIIFLVSLNSQAQTWTNPNPYLYGLQWQGFKATKGIIFGTDTSRKTAGTTIIIGDTMYVANGTYYRKFGYAGITGSSGTSSHVYSGLGLSNVNDSTLKVDTSSAVILSRQRASATYEPIISTGSTAQYIRGDKSLASFPTNVSTFTNDAGYLTEVPVSSFTWRVRDSVCSRPSYDLDDGDKFLVCPTGTSEFAAKDNQLATYHSDGDTFSFQIATSGDYLQNSASGAVDKFNGSAWVYQNERKKLNNGGEVDSIFASVGHQLAYPLEIKTNNVRRWMWQANGQVQIITAPTTYSTGGYDILVRNSTSRLIQKVPSSTFLTSAVTNVATGLGLSGGPITNTGTIILDTASASVLSRQRAAATYLLIGDTTNKWVSDLRRTAGSTTVEKKIGSTWTTAFTDSVGSGSGSVNVYAPFVKSGDTVYQRFNVLHYGAKGDGTTDDTQAFKDALSAAATAGSGVVWVPYTGSDYIVNGGLQLQSGTDSAQILIPLSSTIAAAKRIKIIGEIAPEQYTAFNGTSIPGAAVIIRSTSTKASNVFGSLAANYTQISFENIGIRTRSKTGGGTDTAGMMTAIDARNLMFLDVNNCRIDNQSAQSTGSQPASTAYGIRCPAQGNFAFVTIRNTLVQNYYTGIYAAEHANLDQVIIATCYQGIYFSATPHPAIANKIHTLWCKYNVVLNGDTWVNINQWDIEDYVPNGTTVLTKWFDHTYDFYEPSGSGSYVNAFYKKQNTNGVVGTGTIDNSVTSTTIVATPIGTVLGIPSATSGSVVDYTVGTTSLAFPYAIVNTTHATGLGGFKVQRSGVNKFAIIGNPNSVTDDFGAWDYINSRSIWTYSGTNKDLTINTGITAKFNGNLELTTSGVKVGIGAAPTYALDVSGTPVSNILARITTASGTNRFVVNSGSNSGVTFQEGGTNKWTFFSAAGVFGVYDETNSQYGFQLSTARKMSLNGVTATAWLTLPAVGTAANTAPLSLITGTFQTTAQAGALEYVTPQLTFTNGGLQRQEIPLIQQTRRSTQFDATSNTTLANVGSLFATLVAGKTYRFEAVLYTTSNVAAGVKFAIGGTATATDIVYEAVVIDGNVNAAQTRAAAIATAVGAVTAVTAAKCTITGTITVNAAGTLTVQFAQNVSNGTASSILRGSYFVVTEML